MDDREYELKKAELALREREVSAKEKEVKTSKWFNPLTIAIYVAALGLFGNILTNVLNNKASDKAEHARAQSNLVLSVIKTNGNEDDACKNLNFFVRIGWLDDLNNAIHNSCGAKGESGVPTLPAASESGGGGYGVGGFGQGGYGGGTPYVAFITLNVRVEDADSHEPIENATVTVTQASSGSLNGSPSITGSTSRSAGTDAKGVAMLSFVTSYDSLTVSEEGYETITKSLAQLMGLGATSQLSPTVTIALRHAPPAKHSTARRATPN